MDDRVVLVPLLLSSGFHDRVDLPRVIARCRPSTARASVLGPDPLLAVALADRLDEAGRRPGDAVVLAAAGSSDPDALASVHIQTRLLDAELARRDADHAQGTVTVGFGSAGEPSVGAAVAAARTEGQRVVISSYLLARGFFASRLTEAGADLVAAPLEAHPAVVELILRRASTQG